MVSLSHLDECSDTPLQDGMHHFEDKVPIHRGPVDILKLNSWTWRAIDPTDMSTDKALNIRCRRQFFYQGHCTPDADNPLSHASCCVIHDLLFCATNPPSTVMVCPVTNEAASEQSHTTVSATSSGVPRRPIGSRATICFSSCSPSFWRTYATMGVRM